MCKVSEIIHGNEAQFQDDKPALNSNDLTFFKYACVMSKKVSHVTKSYRGTIRDYSPLKALKSMFSYTVTLSTMETEYSHKFVTF
jgi:hypothetical protein